MRSFVCTAVIAFFLAAASASAAPFPLTVAASEVTDNVAYTYTTGSDLSGLGKAEFALNAPGPGVYLVTFAVNFAATGSAATPTIFGCVVNVRNVRTIAEASAFSEMNSSWYIGLSGSGIANVTKAHLQLGVVCGSGDGSAWTYGDRPLEVTLIKLAGHVKGLLNGAQVVRHLTPALAH